MSTKISVASGSVGGSMGTVASSDGIEVRIGVLRESVATDYNRTDNRGWIRLALSPPRRITADWGFTRHRQSCHRKPVLLAQSIYHSTLTITTLGIGDFLPVGLGRVLTAIETSLGAIIIALLVFVFGRSMVR